MKVYHYDGYYGFYSYTTEEPEVEGVGLPANSTNIEPPLNQCKEDEIPVFKNSEWIIVKDDFWRPTWCEWNYDAGRTASTYTHLDLSVFSNNIFPGYPCIPQIINTGLSVMAICQKVKLIQKKFDFIVQKHKQYINNPMLFSSSIPLDSPNSNLSTSPTNHYEAKLEAESMIYLMRRVLDTLVQLSYLLTNEQDVITTKKIEFNEIGKFSEIKTPKSDIEKIIVGDGKSFQQDKTSYLTVINHLFNSFKHSFMHDESYNLHTTGEWFAITSYQAKQNNHQNVIIYHNHNIHHLVMGFQDTIIRILKNQQTYIKLHKNI